MAIIDEILSQLPESEPTSYKNLHPELKKRFRAESLRIALARATKRGWLEKQNHSGEVYLKITKSGKEHLAKKSEVKKLLPWQLGEGETSICVVVFDIPEKKRSLRDLLRRKLKEAGFVGWQKSVWVGKNINLPALREFLFEAALDEFVLALETADLGNENLQKILAEA